MKCEAAPAQGRRMRIQPTALKPLWPAGTQQAYHRRLFPKLLPAVKRPLVLCLMLEGLTIDETPAKHKNRKDTKSSPDRWLPSQQSSRI